MYESKGTFCSKVLHTFFEIERDKLKGTGPPPPPPRSKGLKCDVVKVTDS